MLVRSSSCCSLRARSRGRASTNVPSSPARVASPAGNRGPAEERPFVPFCEAEGAVLDLSADLGRGRAGPSRSAAHSQFNVLAERINTLMAGQQRQTEADRRRITQLERRVEESLRENQREGDGRERWAELQGSVSGLIDETQTLARRIDGLDERLWARTNGSEADKQRHRDLEQQVQGLEQQNRLHHAAVEEAQKRQVAKMCRMERALDDLAKRSCKSEEELRSKQAIAQRQGTLEQRLEARLAHFDQQQAMTAASLQDLQLQVEEALRVEAPCGSEESADCPSVRIEEAVEAAELIVTNLERRMGRQLEDLAASVASLKVKTEGNSSRVASLAERLESLHEPALEVVRGELAQARQQDRRDVEAEISILRAWVKETTEGCEENVEKVRGDLRNLSAQVAPLSLQQGLGLDGQDLCEGRQDPRNGLRDLHARMCTQEQKVEGLRMRMDVAHAPAGDGLKDVQRRLEWLEEQRAFSTVTEVVAEEKGSGSSAAKPGPGQQESVPLRALAAVDTKCTSVSEIVADMEARLLEVEAALQEGSSRRSSHESSGVPPMPLYGSGNRRPRRRGSGELSGGMQELQEKLVEVASYLETCDDLAERVEKLERRLLGCSSTAMAGS